jgi:hypothetical protein
MIEDGLSNFLTKDCARNPRRQVAATLTNTLS